MTSNTGGNEDGSNLWQLSHQSATNMEKQRCIDSVEHGKKVFTSSQKLKPKEIVRFFDNGK